MPRKEVSYSSALRSTSASISCTILDAERTAKSRALSRSRNSSEVTMVRIATTAKTLPEIKIISGRDHLPEIGRAVSGTVISGFYLE
jgi:hypothetical protein